MAFQKGHKTNLGRKHSEVSITKMRESQRGQKRSEKVKKKLSDIRKKLWAKPEFKQRFSGENSHLWKGDKAGYWAMHDWVKSKKGNPVCCEKCGKVGKKVGRNWNIDWANKKHNYLRNLDDYVGLCQKCHRQYDLLNNK